MIKHLPKLPLLLLIIGAILRVAGTGAAAIWFDEANTLYRTTIPFLKLFSENSEGSGNILLELILYLPMKLSHSLWLLRLPSMLAGLAGLWLVWKLMRRLDFTLPQQIVTSSVAAFLPGLLWIAQDARSYSLLSLLFLAALWFAIEGRWIGLLAMCGLTIYAHSTGPVWSAAALLVALFLHKTEWKKTLYVGLGCILAWTPAIIRILNSWNTVQPWQPVLTGGWLLFSTLQSFWPEKWSLWFGLAAILLAAITFVRLVAILILAITKKQGGRLIYLALWLLPYLGLILYSLVMRSNVVNYRTLSPMLFPFALWLGWELGQKHLSNYISLAAWSLMLVAGLAIWNPADRGGYLDRVADQIRSNWRSGDTLVYTTVTVALPFDYYLGDLPHIWDETIKNNYLAVPPISRTETLNYSPSRAWVIIPEELTLIAPFEWITLMDLVKHQAPVYTVNYIQAAPIHIYLVEMNDHE